MTKKLLLFPCGTMVKIKISGIKGMITCSSIRFDKIQYEVTYFLDSDHKVSWMNENEFETSDKKQSIGYK